MKMLDAIFLVPLGIGLVIVVHVLFHPREACKGFREFVADLERMPIRPANGVLGWIFVVVAVATLVAVVVSFARG